MVYDQTKDKKLFEKKADFGKFDIVVSVHQYNGGEKKLQLSRLVYSETQEPQWRKLGRLNLDELNAILPIIQEAKEVMEDDGN